MFIGRKGLFRRGNAQSLQLSTLDDAWPVKAAAGPALPADPPLPGKAPAPSPLRHECKHGAALPCVRILEFACPNNSTQNSP